MPQPRRGRTRSETARRSILEATRDQLAEHGYDRLSIDRIAAAAGVGKQTIYRWWPSKSAVVAECVLDGYVLADASEMPDSGDLRRDLSHWLGELVGIESRKPQTSALALALISATAESPDVAARLRERFSETAQAVLTARITQAERQGQISPTAPAPILAEILFGTLVYRLLSRQDVTQDLIDSLCDILLR
ncbi:TetR/AcrR family transcriptional regulator [Actinocorallia sp. A-T 12471]|uniref:TetR/AcrR family transcriptional regulator n=1 Tax=Actinocorallia sp. A-T 12471 TaxID=3089813 RepID=UPI0029CB19C6|nr:TetR/AcrR family transcriptional regulator [Actinocorallia sp. A-T 12471]MDX6741445.1 TetR/AcrR family transcriptional regulator [Actinocorallia sp. A-T 12471]